MRGWGDMHRILILSCFLFGLLEPAAAQQGSAHSWTTYENARFGFSLRYPADLFEIERTSQAGDGVVFRARDADAVLLVGALPNSDHRTIASYQQFVARKSYSDYQITYQPRGTEWFVLSGKRAEKIFYEKVVFSCSGHLINSFAIIYPADRREIFDRVVERLEASFQPGTKGCGQGAANIVRPNNKTTRTATGRSDHHPRSALADRIARQRGQDVLVVLRRTSPPYDTKVVRGYASR